MPVTFTATFPDVKSFNLPSGFHSLLLTRKRLSEVYSFNPVPAGEKKAYDAYREELDNLITQEVYRCQKVLDALQSTDQLHVLTLPRREQS
jgi:hypothetical protein